MPVSLMRELRLDEVMSLGSYHLWETQSYIVIISRASGPSPSALLEH